MKDHEFSQSVAKLLAADGFAPSIDQDGDIALDFEDTRYWIEVDEHDRNCLCVLMPGFWPIESDDERYRALAVASTINASRKLVKIYLHRNDTSACADVLFERLEDFPPLLRRVLVALRMAVDGFAEGMRENTGVLSNFDATRSRSSIMTDPIDSSDPDARQQAALEALEASHGADPTREGFGFFSCDDHAWGCGMFHWYPSMARLLKAISQEVVHAFLDEQEDGESNALAQRLQALTEGFGPVDKLGPAQFETLRSELRGVQDLRWIGTFDELCTSADEWPSEVRGRFRDQHESSYDYDADSSTPTAATERSREQRIGPDELEDFVVFVGEFGY